MNIGLGGVCACDVYHVEKGFDSGFRGLSIKRGRRVMCITRRFVWLVQEAGSNCMSWVTYWGICLRYVCVPHWVRCSGQSKHPPLMSTPPAWM